MATLLIVTTSYPSPETHEGLSAAGMFVQDFAMELARNGHKVKVIAPALTNSQTQIENLTTNFFKVSKLPLSNLSIKNPLHYLTILKTLISGAQCVNKLCEDTKPDHIIAMWALPSGYWARRASLKYKIPYHIWALGSDIWSLRSIPIVKNQLHLVLSDARTLFADGKLLSQDVQQLSGRSCIFLPSTRKHHIKTTKKWSHHPPYTITYIGRWHKNKGVDLLVKALDLLSKETWSKIKAINIAGGGPLENQIKDAINDLNEKGKPVSNIGYLDRNSATSTLERTDYLVIPSRIESIPLVLSDGISSGCPVICTPVGDLSQLTKEFKIGFVATSTKPEHIAYAIASAVTTPPAAFKNGIYNAQIFFDITHTTKQAEHHILNNNTYRTNHK